MPFENGKSSRRKEEVVETSTERRYVERVITPPKIEDLSGVKEFENLLVYGDPGCGKTVMTGTTPRALILAADKGTISAARKNPLSTAKVVQLRDLSDPWGGPGGFTDTVAWLKAGAAKDFEWLVIDSATHLQEMALRWIIDQEIELGKRDKNGKARDEDVPQLQDHYKWQLMWKRYVRTINDLPINVLWTALAMRKEDEDGTTLVMPQLDGKDYGISAWTCAEMDSVGYMETIERKSKPGTYFRRITFQRTENTYGKDRYDVLIPRVDNPSVPKLHGLITGTIKPKIQNHESESETA